MALRNTQHNGKERGVWAGGHCLEQMEVPSMLLHVFDDSI